MDKLKVLLVEGSVIARMAILDAVNSTEYGIVEHAASNGGIALEWLKQCSMDVVLIDVMIIENEGIDLLKMIKSNAPDIEIIIMSNGFAKSAAITLESLKAGALDFIQKPSEQEHGKYRGELKTQLNTLLVQIINKKSNDFYKSTVLVEEPVFKSEGKGSSKRDVHSGFDLILIASSTGGPVALDTIFGEFPTGVHKPILIVQHMPPEFTNLMALTMNKKYHLPIYEGKDSELLKDGRIIIAPGGRHMTVEGSGGRGAVIKLLDTENVNGVKPSADVLFKSAANSFKGKNILVIVLTGMGNDGTKGIIELKKSCNCYCITQSERTCVVYGMPKCVYDAGLSDEVADLKDIAHRIGKIAAE